jgi:hypothetical protein
MTSGYPAIIQETDRDMNGSFKLSDKNDPCKEYNQSIVKRIAIPMTGPSPPRFSTVAFLAEAFESQVECIESSKTHHDYDLAIVGYGSSILRNPAHRC